MCRDGVLLLAFVLMRGLNQLVSHFIIMLSDMLDFIPSSLLVTVQL